MNQEKVDQLLNEIKQSIALFESTASSLIRACGAASVFLYQLEKEMKAEVEGEGKGADGI